MCCKGGIQLAYIGNKNVREDELKTRLKYALVRLKNLHNTYTRGAIRYRRFLRTMCYELLDWIEFSNQLNEFKVFI